LGTKAHQKKQKCRYRLKIAAGLVSHLRALQYADEALILQAALKEISVALARRLRSRRALAPIKSRERVHSKAS
jgi:hypothetical protein